MIPRGPNAALKKYWDNLSVEERIDRGRKISVSMKGNVPWNKGLKGVQVAWNKGLTKETDLRVAKYATLHTDEWKKEASERMLGDKNPMRRIPGLAKRIGEKIKKNGTLAGENNSFYGKQHTVERKIAHSNFMKEYTKDVEVINSYSKRTTDLYIKGKMNFSSGKFYSEKNGKTLHYRSTYELAAYEILENDVEVVSYVCEPFFIFYIYKGKKKRYIPDIFVEYRDGIKLLIEVMSVWQYSDEKKLAKLEAGKHYCKEQGFEFNIWTEGKLGKGSNK